MISKRVLSVEQMYREMRIRLRDDLEKRAGKIRRDIKAGVAPKAAIDDVTELERRKRLYSR